MKDKDHMHLSPYIEREARRLGISVPLKGPQKAACHRTRSAAPSEDPFCASDGFSHPEDEEQAIQDECNEAVEE